MNDENLIPLNQRSKESAKKIQQKGGIARAEQARKLREKEKEQITFQLVSQGALGKVQKPCVKNYAEYLKRLSEKENLTPQEAKELREGLSFLRDSSGQKPTDKQEINNTNVQKIYITKDDIESVDKHIQDVIDN
ncbi:MAG: hypothetical protein II234_02530 [Clostridia bacterium]|nr:hypothetical protein [Clostridia bacterium]